MIRVHVLAVVVSVLCTLHLYTNGTPLKRLGLPIEDDLKALMKLAGGDYDNLNQYNYDVAHLPPNDRHLHLHARFFETKIPALGDNSFFYVQESQNDLGHVYSQSINSFYINITDWTIRMRIYKFISPEVAKKYINASDHPSIFNDLRFSDITFHAGCGVTWARTGPEMFLGKMTMGACVAPYKGTNNIIYDENILSRGYLTVHEKWYIQSNGTEIRGKISPYNETRQPVSSDFKPSQTFLVV